MASDYATLVQSAAREGPYQLLGWSMGGITAFAVAAELERRGVVVASVGMIDPSAIARGRDVRADLAFALAAVVHDITPEAAPLVALAAKLRRLRSPRVRPRTLLAWAEEARLIPEGAMSADSFECALRLYKRHFALLRRYRPRAIAAPVRQWWASERRSSFDWSPYCRSGLSESLLGGTHFSIVRPPFIDRIAADLSAESGATAAAEVTISSVQSRHHAQREGTNEAT